MQEEGKLQNKRKRLSQKLTDKGFAQTRLTLLQWGRASAKFLKDTVSEVFGIKTDCCFFFFPDSDLFITLFLMCFIFDSMIHQRAV